MASQVVVDAPVRRLKVRDSCMHEKSQTPTLREKIASIARIVKQPEERRCK